MQEIPEKDALSPVPNWDEQACFGCGPKNQLGLRLQFYSDKTRVYSFPRVSTAMTGWGHTIHGGIVSTLLDEIMGWTVIHFHRKLGVTRSMTVDFLKPVFAGEELTLIGSVIENTGARSAQIGGEIYNASRVLCARSVGDFSIMEPRLAVRLGLVEQQYMEEFGQHLGF
jgi:uncharacterized protein (TIGR00369 family)